mmetsp:Transcript_54916/g.128398  ORF Transcript_54916/g.128398 Transcript_54916/m.128398 type:complete len:91 (+) Transcript_54916:179-451(+)
MPPESDNSKQAPSEAATKGPLLSSVVELVNLNDDAKAIEGLSALNASEMTALVREASNWAFRLDLQERIEQVRANELGMLEDETTLSSST